MFSELLTYDDGSEFKPDRIYKRGRPVCIVPGCDNIAHNKGKNYGGYILTCAKHYYGKHTITGGYIANKKSYCENIDGRLGFKCTATIVDSCMITIDHIDENHHNHNPKNLHSLCACCHNYKTKFFGHVKSFDKMMQIMQENREKFMTEHEIIQDRHQREAEKSAYENLFETQS